MSKGHPLRQLLATLGIVYLVWILGLWALQRRIVYPGWLRLPEPEPELSISGLEPWWLDTEDGPIQAWWIPGAGVSKDRPGPVMMAWHGNAAFIDDVALKMAPYRDLGLSVLLVEYRGYGRSAGIPSEETIMADADAWRSLTPAQRKEQTLRTHRVLGSPFHIPVTMTIAFLKRLSPRSSRRPCWGGTSGSPR